MLAGVCIVVAALWAAQEVLVPLALAVLLTFLLAPVVRRLESTRLPRVPAVLLVVLLAFSLLTAVGWVVGEQILQLANDLPTYKDNIREKLSGLRGPGDGILERARGTIDELTEEFQQPATTQTTQPAQALSGGNGSDISRLTLLTPAGFRQAIDDALHGRAIPVVVTSQPPTGLELLSQSLTSLAGPLATAGIVIILVIFMLLKREDLRDRLIRLLGHGQLRLTTTALDDAASRISRFLLAQAIVNGSYGVAVAFGLWIIGMIFGGDQGFPNWALWGLLAAVIRFIPYVGPWIGASIPILLSALVFQGLGALATTICFFVALELLSNNLMEPWLYGSSTGMSETAVLVSAVFWTWLWGPIGLVMATPLTTCLVVLGKHVPQLAFLDILLGADPVLDPPSRVYQRLLALDQEEATELVQEFREKMELPELYETVLLPALAMAEQDRHARQLDKERQDLIHSAMRDIVEELGDGERLRRAQTDAGTIVEAAKGQREITSNSHASSPCRVLCLPASDEADEIVGLMLAQLLSLRGYEAEAVSTHALAAEMLQKVSEVNPDVVVVSALPPSATSRARYLCKRLQAQSEDRAMVVGLWTVKGNLKRARDRLTCIAAVQVVTTLGDAIEQVREHVQRQRIVRGSPDAGIPAP